MGAMFSNPRSVSFGHDGLSVLVTDTYGVRQVRGVSEFLLKLVGSILTIS